jgi:hypothetical protein
VAAAADDDDNDDDDDNNNNNNNDNKASCINPYRSKVELNSTALSVVLSPMSS